MLAGLFRSLSIAWCWRMYWIVYQMRFANERIPKMLLLLLMLVLLLLLRLREAQKREMLINRWIFSRENRAQQQQQHPMLHTYNTNQIVHIGKNTAYKYMICLNWSIQFTAHYYCCSRPFSLYRAFVFFLPLLSFIRIVAANTYSLFHSFFFLSVSLHNSTTHTYGFIHLAHTRHIYRKRKTKNWFVVVFVYMFIKFVSIQKRRISHAHSIVNHSAHLPTAYVDTRVICHRAFSMNTAPFIYLVTSAFSLCISNSFKWFFDFD